MLIQGQEFTMARKKVISASGPRTPREPPDDLATGPQIDFADAVKHKQFEKYVEDLKTRRIPLKRLQLSDKMGNGLRVIIRPTGHISYHCHYFAPEWPADLVADDEDEAKVVRPLKKIGVYPESSVAKVRQRALVITTLAKNGMDYRWALLPRVLREIDKEGLKWRPL